MIRAAMIIPPHKFVLWTNDDAAPGWLCAAPEAEVVELLVVLEPASVELAETEGEVGVGETVSLFVTVSVALMESVVVPASVTVLLTPPVMTEPVIGMPGGTESLDVLADAEALELVTVRCVAVLDVPLDPDIRAIANAGLVFPESPNSTMR